MAIQENPKSELIKYLNIMLAFKYGYQKFKVIAAAAAANGADDAIVLKSYDGDASDDEIHELKTYLEEMRNLYYAVLEG